jgi:hypothetical protein
MEPVVVLSARPAGSDGEMDQAFISPPELLGVSVEIVVPAVALNVVGEIEMSGNNGVEKVKVTVAVSLPPRPVAVTV